MPGAIWTGVKLADRDEALVVGVEPAADVLEHDGRIMRGHPLLRRAARAPSRSHARLDDCTSFHPHQRWQFSALRLALDA